MLAPKTERPVRAAGADRQSWQRAPVSPEISPNGLHIWRVSLEVPWSWNFDEALSLDDRMRADRFRFESDRRRFCVARASLRLILGAFKTQSFFNCWTRKEAYIKARGEGLSCSLDEFDVSLAPGAPAALLDSRLDPKETSRWRLQDLFPAPGYAATVAVEGGFSQLALWDFDQDACS